MQKEEYNKFAAYAQSKTADILFAAALARRYGDRGIIALSAEPGGTTWTTGIVKYLTEEDRQFRTNPYLIEKIVSLT
jgi:NAD(P)-dependent dehydrogenase (short-subunit alcohol dehydrogenase family)